MANKLAPQKSRWVPDRLSPRKLVGQKPAAPARPSAKPAAQVKPENRFVKFFREIRSELRKVVWPSRETVINLTILVLVVCAAVGIVLGLVDYGFEKLITWLISVV